MTDIIQVRWQARRGTAAALATANEVPLEGEVYKELDTGREKTGDGSTHYNDLPYTIPGPYKVTGLADGDTMVWNAALGLWLPGTAGAAIEAGTGISIDEDSAGIKTISTNYGAIALSGRVATYAALPVGLGSGDAGKAYMVDADGLIYIWDGAAFPADGSGVMISGISGAPDGSIPTSGTIYIPPKPTKLAQVTIGGDIYFLPAYKKYDPGTDPYFASVISLLHFASDFTDQKGLPWTAHGSAVVASGGVFGGNCLNIGNGGVDFLTSPYQAAFDIGAGDATIEMWVYQTVAASQASTFSSMMQTSGSGYGPFRLESYTASNVRLLNSPSGTSWYNTTQAGGWSLNAWHHIAYVKSGSNGLIYVDGVQKLSNAGSSPLWTSSNLPLAVGGQAAAGLAGAYKISEYRFTNGIARYTSNFTPPAGPFPDS